MKRIFITARMIVCVLLLLQIITACGVEKNKLQNLKAYETAVTSINTGNQWYKKGCYENALENIFKAHELFSLIDDQDGVAKSFNNLGNIYRAKKDTESALLFFDEAIKIYKTIHNLRGAVQAISNKSAVYIDLEMFDKADTFLNEAEQLSKNENFIYPPVLNNRGILFTRLGKYSNALTVLNRALSVIDKENYFEYSAVNFALGNLMVETKDYIKAEEYFKKALDMDRKVGFNNGIAGDLFAIGSLSIASGDYDSACDYLKRSLKVYTLLNDKQNADKSLILLKKTINSVSGETADITITEYFINIWSNGNRLTSTCE